MIRLPYPTSPIAAAALAAGLLACLFVPDALAASSPAKPEARKAPPAKAAAPAAKKPVAGKKGGKAAVAAAAPAFVLPDATAEQIDAAERVYYGTYECEFNQSVGIVASPKHPHYVDVKHAKADYLMKPVLSSTGAVRLEDVKGGVLMVQIASKSMLMNVKTGQRIVDACVSPKQRELIEAARLEKAAEDARAAEAKAAGLPAGASASTMAPLPLLMAPAAAASAPAPVAAVPAPAPVSGLPAASVAPAVSTPSPAPMAPDVPAAPAASAGAR